MPETDTCDRAPQPAITPDDMGRFHELRNYLMVLIALHRLVRTRPGGEITGADVFETVNDLCAAEIPKSTVTYGLHQLDEYGIATVDKGYKSHNWDLTDEGRE